MSENRYLAACAAIPRGETRTFAQLAALAGKPAAARAAGRAVAECPSTTDVAWHRVIAADGSLARDPVRAAEQLARLRDEDARPRADEANIDFARRTGRLLFGDWRSRRAMHIDDPNLARIAAHAIEALASEEDALARGFAVRGVDVEKSSKGSEVRDPRANGTNASAPPSDASPARGAHEQRDLASANGSPSTDLSSVDWDSVRHLVRERGYAVIEGVLDESECAHSIARFDADEPFERTIEMAPRGYGIGRYRYFREPLPEPAASIRSALYTQLRAIAADVPSTSAFPESLDAFWNECRAAGQQRASSILLRYTRGGVNHPHRDIYGQRWFPYQAVCVLSQREVDFAGGEFTFLRERPDGTEHEEALPLDRGDVCVFASRSVCEKRGARTRWVGVRHGMRVVTRGERYALGIVLNLAE